MYQQETYSKSRLFRCPKKVAYILTAVEFGGSERVSLTFLKNLNRENYIINPIVLYRPWESNNLFITRLESEGYKVERIPVARHAPDEGRDYLRVLRCFNIIYSLLRKGAFDLVHTHGYFADTVGIVASKLLGIKTIATCHGYISNNITYRLYNKLDRIILRHADRVIAVSTALKNELVSRGIQAKKISVIRNAVDGITDDITIFNDRQMMRNRLKVTDNDFVIGYVGRLSNEKGIKYLIESVSLIMKTIHNVRLVVVGDGPEKEAITKMVTQQGISDETIIAGFQKDVTKWLSAMDLFVLPSLTEGIPMALLEAMQFRLPVVATRVGGVPEIIEAGHNGYLVKPADVQALSQAIVNIIENPDIRRKLVEQAIDTLEKYDVKQWCSMIENEYDDMLFAVDERKNESR